MTKIEAWMTNTEQYVAEQQEIDENDDSWQRDEYREGWSIYDRNYDDIVTWDELKYVRDILGETDEQITTLMTFYGGDTATQQVDFDTAFSVY